MHLFPQGLPSPALFQTPSYFVQEYDRDNVTIRVLWQSPQDDGGASVINYTINVSPGLVPLTTTATSAMVTIPYNVMHTVSIVVTNCNGSSSVVMETIPAIGMARYLSLKVTATRVDLEIAVTRFMQPMPILTPLSNKSFLGSNPFGPAHIL